MKITAFHGLIGITVALGTTLGGDLWGQEARPEAARGEGSAQAAVIRLGTEVLAAWRSHQHLYVKGDVGVGQAQLDALEQWLDTNAPNWVVVVLKHAAGEEYTDPDGRRHVGVEAVNQALGKGLRNRTAFGQQVDPRTREPNAAFLLIFLDERKLSYAASEAQTKRGLGRDHWQGRLDAPAIAAMRNGGRVVDAVKGTIANIDRQLEARLSAEAVARQQAAQQADAALNGAANALTLLEAETAKFNRGHGGMTGDLARPDLPGLRAELEMGRAALARGDTARAQSSAQTVRRRVETHLQAIAQIDHDRARVDALAVRIKEEQGRPFGVAGRDQLGAAQEALARARGEHQRGDSSYRAHLETARQAIAAAEVAITAAERLHAQRRVLWTGGTASVLVALSLAGLLLNRGRRSVKREAESLFKTWEQGLGEKNVALFQLLDRRASVVGPSVEEAEERYTGETLELSRRIIKDVDELFIMSGCAGHALQEAQALLEPTVLWPRLGNLFLAGRFRRTLGLLRDHPIAFRPDSAIELVVRGRRSERDRLVGNLATYQPFTLTFNQLIETFNERAARALAALDLVESSLIAVGTTLEGVQQRIDTTLAAKAGIEQQAAADGLFRVSGLFTQLLPGAQAALAEALQMALKDPVGSLRGRGAQAKQQAEEAAALVRTVGEVRRATMPRLREAGRALAQTGLASQWIEAELRRLSERADRLVEAALSESVAPGIQRLSDELMKLAERAERALALAGQRQKCLQGDLGETTVAIDAARRELGAALGLDPARVLRENGADPSEFVRRATEQNQAAAEALGRGDVVAAERSLEALAQLAREARKILTDSRAAFAEHAPAVAALEAESGRLAALAPAHQQILNTLKARYAASVLVLGAGDPAHPDANGTIEDNLEECHAHLAAAGELAGRSQTAFRAGRLLEAAELLRQVKARQGTTLFRLEEVKEKEARLAATETANARRLAELEGRRRECEGLVADRTAMPPTQRAFQQASVLVDRARLAAQRVMGDPFQAANELAAAAQALEAVADKARCDRDVSEQAERSLRAAATQLTEARRLEAAAAADTAGDSVAIRQARAGLAPLETAFRSAQQQARAEHGDWHALDAEANHLAGEAGRFAATLRGELQRAQTALAALSASAAAVRSAGGWTGGYGVRIFGAPGSDLLGRGRAALQAGDYDQALALATSARRAAELAVAEAEAEVRRRRFAEQQRLEEERRRREAEEEARRSSCSPSWGGGSSADTASGWGSTGSGVSTSSFSSDSGVATSSW